MKYLSEIPSGLYQTNLPLHAHCSMRTGGNADIAFFPSDEGELIGVLSVLKREGLGFVVLGNASNALLPDDGLRLPVIFTTGMTCRHLCDENGPVETRGRESVLYAQCGVSFTELSLYAAKRCLSGLEFAFGIPGTVGGAVYMNAGAYDGEVAHVAKAVRYLDLDTLEPGVLHGEQTQFGYRRSVFSKQGGRLILGAYFALQPGREHDIRDKANGFMRARKEKQPLEYPSCGSVFKRPEGYYAGALIERAGLKGTHIGGAFVSEKHAGFIVNKGGAKTQDVLRLIELVRKTVMERFGVLLEPEIKIINDCSGQSGPID